MRKVLDSTSRKHRTVDTLTYSLDDTDGRPLKQPLIYRGEDGYVLVVGGVAAIGAFGILVLVVGLNGRLLRQHAQAGRPL
ncbi:hypothetical protein [Brevibacterium renqingii]|uniref:hypothetical protein n=1 Tax=Brevibacterium renqingii TaxID=2776916 RepID=UPI001AE00F53|nr:hypothetical protein [Brevibacterium renqingii]